MEGAFALRAVSGKTGVYGTSITRCVLRDGAVGRGSHSSAGLPLRSATRGGCGVGGPKRQQRVSSQFWGPEVQGRGASGAGSFRGLSPPLQTAVSLLRLLGVFLLRPSAL